MKKISWGIMGTARIGLERVIPAMQKGNYTVIQGIASRTLEQAEKAAGSLQIPKAYGSYDDMLADKSIDAVYIPLPNHLHVEWAVKSLKAGKHVLCEKPIGLNYREAEYLYREAKKYPHLKVMEAFMYRFHPQWQKTKELVQKQVIGDVKTIHSFFSYYKDDPCDIRNRADTGGGGLLDIGCYCISTARFLFDKEPGLVCGTIEYDPVFHTDRFVSGILVFENKTSTFTCATQLIPYQRVFVYGTKGRIEIEIPFNAPDDTPCRLFLQTGSGTREISFDVCNQYTLQGDAFSSSILENTETPVPIDDAVANMKVIDRMKQSAETGSWVRV
ncbi:MAG: Gfo/Idh/MocA family oxidoreductase [Spirochaetales bacterium]|nr:Gfo/Idh/MocA family oxidoreductase [Spirochaetales bacterium]